VTHDKFKKLDFSLRAAWRSNSIDLKELGSTLHKKRLTFKEFLLEITFLPSKVLMKTKHTSVNVQSMILQRDLKISLLVH